MIRNLKIVYYINANKSALGDGEMAQCIKGFLWKHEKLSLDPESQHSNTHL